MGRAGSGGGGGHRSSGGHSSHRSSGGHHVSSHRAGSSHLSHSYSGSSYHGSSYHRSYYGGGGGSSIGVFVAIVIIITMVLVLSNMSTSSSIRSTIEREPLTGTSFMNDCIVDEIGWFDNVPGTERALKEFWQKTGVQPYIVLHKYDERLTSDQMKDAWANAYYDKYIDNEYTFLYIYFAEEDTDNDVGYMAYINGKQVSSVMDSEAVGIFWNYIDNAWYSDMSTDEMFTTVFNKTAKTIMKVSTSFTEVLIIVAVLAAVVIIVGLLIMWWRLKTKRDAEKAKETERILNTPIEKLSEEEDHLVKKYDEEE